MYITNLHLSEAAFCGLKSTKLSCDSGLWVNHPEFFIFRLSFRMFCACTSVISTLAPVSCRKFA